MAIAPTVARELLRSGIDFQLLHHRLVHLSLEAARVARVAPAHVAKSVLLTDRHSHVLAVIPADAAVDLRLLRHQLGRDLALASETETARVFHDCVFGAVPPLGAAYGVETWVDERLVESSDLFFEAGDHELLVRVGTQDFLQLLNEAGIGRFATPALTPAGKRSRPGGTQDPWRSPASDR